MPMSVTYATVNGVLVEENRGGDVTTYVPDTLGSVVKTVDESGAVTSEIIYWPYGETKSSDGINPGKWEYVGTLGYYKDATARCYVRARIYRADIVRWMIADPFGPLVQQYAYTEQPLSMVDPSGLLPDRGDFGKFILPYPVYDLGFPRPDERFGYGNWCGKNRPGSKYGFPKPIDCLDACCHTHDTDLGECTCFGQSGKAHCNLFKCVTKVDCKKSPYPKECERAKNAIMLAFQFLCKEETLARLIPPGSECGYTGVCNAPCAPAPIVQVPPPSSCK